MKSKLKSFMTDENHELKERFTLQLSLRTPHVESSESEQNFPTQSPTAIENSSRKRSGLLINAVDLNQIPRRSGGVKWR